VVRPAIPATGEAEVAGTQSKVSPDKKSETLSEKQKQKGLKT
jgi:hypothetical protein